MKPAEAAKTAPELQEQTSRGHGIAAAASLFLAVLAALSGDIAMAGVAVVARLMTKDVFLQWALAASAITLGSFLIFGLPQIYAWRRTTTPNRPTLDARTAWAVRILSRGRVVLFVLASVTGGPLAIGWYYGRKRHPQAVFYTALSSIFLAIPWAAFYLGVIHAL
jgi:hypothetical protein